MKIHKLEITGFGPFKEKQSIDFDALTADGIFMLEGPTGAGKSSIIDAIVWVLYGTTAHESAHSIKISVSGRVRSDYVGTDEETRVLMEFSAQGHRYRIQRTPTYMVTKSRGEGEKKVDATARLEFIKPTAESLTRLDEIGSKVQDILGMGREQFSQLVVLPQGDFAAFLHASSDERKRILQTIFKTYFYDDMQKFFEAKRKEYSDLIKSLDSEITRHIHNLNQEAGEESELDFDDVLEVMLDQNETDSKKLQILDEIITTLKPDPKKDVSSKSALDKQIKPIQEKITILQESQKKIQLKADTKAKLEALLESQEEIDELAAQIALREKVRSVEADLEHRESAESKRENAESELLDEYSDWTAAEISKEITKQKGERDKLVKATSQHPTLRKLLDTAQGTLEAIEEVELAKTNLKTANNEIPKAKTQIEALKAEISEMKLVEKNEYAHVVAKKLRPGSACPICGSKEHPKPLKSKGTFSAAKLQRLEEDLEDWRNHLSTMESLKSESTRAISKKLPTRATVKAEIKALEKKIGNADNEEWDLSQVSDLLEELETALPFYVEYERANKDYEKFDDRIQKILDKFELDEDDLSELFELNVAAIQKRIEKHNKDVDVAKTILDQPDIKKLPDPEAVQGQIEELIEKRDSLQEEIDEVVDRIALANKVTKNLELAENGIQASLAEISEAKVKAEPYLDLDTWISGKNDLGLTLSNYVLQERLEMVLERASNHLRRVSHGKYEFRLNEDRVGRKRIAGLGIQILDYRAGKERLAETLSGGETFYASLSLALGLAEVVKAEEGGLELGTLFIDEGFGSLSDETLSEVIDVLEELRSADRIIGIISHVEGMKTQIPLRVEVRASDAGPSTIRFATAELQ